MKHNPKPEEKKAAGLDDDFAVKKDFAQSCTLRRIAAAVLYLSILFCCTITALKLPSLAVLFPLAAVLLIPPLCFAFNCFAASKVEFAVKASSSCPRGESCHCEIVLRNDSIIPLPFVRCTLILLNKLNGENRISVIRCSVPALSENRCIAAAFHRRSCEQSLPIASDCFLKEYAAALPCERMQNAYLCRQCSILTPSETMHSLMI